MPLVLIRYEAKARHLSYLIEQLKTCPMKLPTDDSAPVDEIMERRRWPVCVGDSIRVSG